MKFEEYRKMVKSESPGRILALDLGEKRIGVALSDETLTIASSYAVIERKSRKLDFSKLKTIIDENQVKLVVVGLATLSSGKEGAKAAWMRDYASDLGKHCDISIEMWDESFSTVDAINSLRERNIRGRRQKNRVDAVAAAFILQSFLDCGHGKMRADFC